jgi:hypothetical protein
MNAPKTSQIKMTQDMYVSRGSESRIKHKKGEVLSINDKPLLLEVPGHVDMLIIPLKNSISQVEPVLKPIDEWSGEALEKSLNIKLSEIINETIKVQFLLYSKKEKEALAKLDLIQAKYPRVSYLNFLRASALFLMGEKIKSKLAIEVALKDFPNDENARSFYESLGGTYHSDAPRSPASSRQNQPLKKRYKGNK